MLHDVKSVAARRRNLHNLMIRKKRNSCTSKAIRSAQAVGREHAKTPMILIVRYQNDSTARFSQARRELVHLAALWHSLATTSLVQTSL
jgi:hypothetical protein